MAQQNDANGIDVSRLDEFSYCILVLWLHGRFSFNQIAKMMGCTVGSVAARARPRSVGGLLPDVRQRLSLQERQSLLDQLRGTRLDKERLNEEIFAVYNTAITGSDAS